MASCHTHAASGILYILMWENRRNQTSVNSVNSVGEPTQQNFCEFCEFRGRINATNHLC